MLNQFGPWASSIDTGSRPQLSAFWRRRLTMLVPTSQSSPVLSRRNRVWLAAATILILAVPTFRPVLAAADPQAKTGEKPAEKAPPLIKGAVTTGSMNLGSYATIYAGSRPEDLAIPYPLSAALARQRDREKLHLTQDQENKLREISNQSAKRFQAISEQMQKRWPKEKMQKPSPDEQKAMEREYMAKLAQVNKEIRKEVEAILTPEQWAEVKIVCIGVPAIGRVVSDPEMRKAVGVTDEQVKQLQRAAEKFLENRKQTERALKEMLVVVLPQQWEQAGPIAGVSDDLEANLLLSGAYVGGLIGPEWKEKMALSDQQRAKLKEVQATLETHFREISKLAESMQASKSNEESQAKQAELTRKYEATYKERREQALAVLTPQQLAILKQIAARQWFLGEMGQFEDRAGSDNKPEGIFKQLKLSEEQMKELRRRYEEMERLQSQFMRGIGQAALQILSPEQQEKLLDEWDKGMYATGTVTFKRSVKK
jgi:hypothetical protein